LAIPEAFYADVNIGETLMPSLKWLAPLALLPLLAAGAAFAQEMSPRVAVPDNSKSGLVGCYRIQGTIYGPYRFQFCLRRGSGSYQVTGGGLNCNGDLDWYDRGRNRVEIDLYKAKCGSGMQWTGDSLSCRGSGIKPLTFGAGDVQVAVPMPIKGPFTLNCTYNPVARGYKPINVTAKRT
jgi:hypothetical protein